MIKEKKLRSLVRSFLIREGFKIGNVSGVQSGDQIPLVWDAEDPHFVKKSEGGGAFTSDEKFKEFKDERGHNFPIRSAFAFSQNVPKSPNDSYPSHLEDVLEALKGKSSSVYTIPDDDMKAYIDDGSKIIARSIVSDIEQRISDGRLPPEARTAKVSIYVTPSSSNHVSDYVEGLRQNLNSYIAARSSSKAVTDEIEREKYKFITNLYKDCAERLKAEIEKFYSDPARLAANFYSLYKSKSYRLACMSMLEDSKLKINAHATRSPGTGEPPHIKFHKKVVEIVKNCVDSEKNFKTPDPLATRISQSETGVFRPFRKIPASQDPGVVADITIRNQLIDQMTSMGAKKTNDGSLVLDISSADASKIRKMNPYLKKRMQSYFKRPESAKSFISLQDVLDDFERETRQDIPKWQKKMEKAGKTDFSIGSVPSRQRRHVSDFIKIDPSAVPTFAHIAIIADDNMESGITLREMKRAIDRLQDQPNPPIIIYGAPLLAIRDQKPRVTDSEKKYTGRRKAGITVPPPVSNITRGSDVYNKIISRLAALGDTQLDIVEPDEEEQEDYT